MTLKELIMKTSFDDILPYLERHETAHRDNLYAFREAYDILKNMKPNRDYHEKATIECHVRPDGSKYVRVLFLDDDVWENELAKQVLITAKDKVTGSEKTALVDRFKENNFIKKVFETVEQLVK